MTLHEWLLLIVDLLKSLVSALAWPVAVVLSVWRIGPALMQLLAGRNVQLKGFGLDLIILAREQQAATSTGDNAAARPALPAPLAAELAPAAPAPAVAARPAFQAIELDLRAELNQFAPAARESTLVTALANARLFGQHEFAYNRIFGSQIAGLKLLDETGPKTVQEAREFFAPYAAQWPAIYTTYPFESWLGFMINSGLVQRNGDTLTATIYGHDFLVYLREARLTEIKPG